MFRPQKAVAAAAAEAKRALKRLSHPAGDFDASRYFRGEHNLGFHNVGTKQMRELARSIHAAHRDQWDLNDAMAFAGALMPDRYLETKSIGLEVVARYRKDFSPRMLASCKRWLANDYSANWATTDAICGLVLGPLLVKHPALQKQMRTWSAHRNMWVRRASIVSLLAPMRNGQALDLVYEIAKRLHPDPHDLIHKAVGWALREAGKVDQARLERYLRANVGAIPRTTFRYAIERFPDARRRNLLALSPVRSAL